MDGLVFGEQVSSFSAFVYRVISKINGKNLNERPE